MDTGGRPSGTPGPTTPQVHLASRYAGRIRGAMGAENSKDRPRAVVLMSGGMDSCLTAAIAAQDHEVAALHISYGQLTEARERQAFQDIADFYNFRERLVIGQPYLGKIGGSALTDPRIQLREADLDATDIPSSY